MGDAAYEQFAPILKRIYGPRLTALGTYRQLCTLYELDRLEARREAMGRKRKSFGALARSLGVTVKTTDEIHALMYTDNPFFSLIGKRRPPPKPKKLDSHDLSSTRAGKHGERLRRPFPEERA